MDNTPSPLPSYIGAVIRTVGGMIAGYAIAKGYITGEQAASIGGGIVAAAVAVWSLYQKYRAHQTLKAA